MGYLYFQKYKLSRMNYVIIFEPGNMNRPLVILGEDDMKRLLKEWKTTVKE